MTSPSRLGVEHRGELRRRVDRGAFGDGGEDGGQGEAGRGDTGTSWAAVGASGSALTRGYVAGVGGRELRASSCEGPPMM